MTTKTKTSPVVHLWRRRWIAWCGELEIAPGDGAEDSELKAVTCSACLSRAAKFGRDVVARQRELDKGKS